MNDVRVKGNSHALSRINLNLCVRILLEFLINRMHRNMQQPYICSVYYCVFFCINKTINLLVFISLCLTNYNIPARGFSVDGKNCIVSCRCFHSQQHNALEKWVLHQAATLKKCDRNAFLYFQLVEYFLFNFSSVFPFGIETFNYILI